MSGSKHFEKTAWIVTALMLVVTMLFMSGSSLGLEIMARKMGYENRLFDNTRVHTIDIVMDNWDEFIANATSEEYYTTALVVDGEAYKNVAIRGKGNTSLSSVSSMNSQRYSFKVEFDHYDSSMTYHGLDKLSLNNLIQDSTMMKDYLTYTMMNKFGAASPLCSFVYITVNGEDWGLYLAVEGIEDSFLERNYGSDHGELYKPDSMSFGGGRGNGKDFDMNDFLTEQESKSSSQQDGSSSGNSSSSGNGSSWGNGGFDPSSIFGNGTMPDMGNFDLSQMPDMGNRGSGNMPDMGNFDPSQMPGNFGGGNMPNMGQSGSEGDGSSFGGGFDFGGMGGFGGMGSSDVKLQYIDDNLSSYSNIWNNAKTDITSADQTRLIESLQKLSTGEQIDSVVDIEQVIRYFVVHNYVCNGDSYTGSMIHNYYLYEEDGQLAMIPWDYNLAFGTFQGGNGQSTVNTPIDAPVSGGAGSDRPMWYWILSDESYTQLYHQYYAEFLNSVDIQAIIDNAYELIKPYVSKDPTAFYSYEEFEQGVETMKQFCALRSESISLQLENGQTATNMSYVDASALTLSDMGSMGGGMGGGFGGGNMPGMSNGRGPGNGSSKGDSESGNTGGDSSGNVSDGSNGNTGSSITDGGTVSGNSGGTQRPSTGTMPGNFDSSVIPEGFDSSMIPGSFDSSMIPEGFDSSMMPGGSQSIPSGNAGSSGSTDNSGSTTRPSRDNTQIPGSNWGSGSMNGSTVTPGGTSSSILLIVSILVLVAGIVLVKFYRY